MVIDDRLHSRILKISTETSHTIPKQDPLRYKDKKNLSSVSGADREIPTRG